MVYNRKKLSIVILTKDEEFGIAGIIKSVKPYAGEVIVVDGHSKDQTKSIVLENGCRFFLDHGRGRGDGVRLGLSKAKGEVVLLFDADGSHESKDIPRFVKLIFNNEADLVIGSRRTGGSFDINVGFTGVIRSAGADFLTAIVNHRFKTNLTDVLYSFRAIRKSIVPKISLESNGFTIEQEMVVKCLKNNFRVSEIPSREKARGWGKSKLKTATGVKFIFHLLKECYS